VGPVKTREIANYLLVAALTAAVSVAFGGCGGPLSSIKNPFSKEKPPLPGERIAVITDPGQLNPSQVTPRPVSLPPAKANASWSQPGGTPANNLGHLALSGSLQKVWSADAGRGSSSSGRLSAVPLVAGGKVYTLDAGGSVTAFAAASGAVDQARR
jgi:outer membrane protein assembly factor BamB